MLMLRPCVRVCQCKPCWMQRRLSWVCVRRVAADVDIRGEEDKTCRLCKTRWNASCLSLEDLSFLLVLFHGPVRTKREGWDRYAPSRNTNTQIQLVTAQLGREVRLLSLSQNEEDGMNEHIYWRRHVWLQYDMRQEEPLLFQNRSTKNQFKKVLL